MSGWGRPYISHCGERPSSSVPSMRPDLWALCSGRPLKVCRFWMNFASKTLSLKAIVPAIRLTQLTITIWYPQTAVSTARTHARSRGTHIGQTGGSVYGPVRPNKPYKRVEPETQRRLFDAPRYAHTITLCDLAMYGTHVHAPIHVLVKLKRAVGRSSFL